MSEYAAEQNSIVLGQMHMSALSIVLCDPLVEAVYSASAMDSLTLSADTLYTDC